MKTVNSKRYLHMCNYCLLLNWCARLCMAHPCVSWAHDFGLSLPGCEAWAHYSVGDCQTWLLHLWSQTLALMWWSGRCIFVLPPASPPTPPLPTRLNLRPFVQVPRPSLWMFQRACLRAKSSSWSSLGLVTVMTVGLWNSGKLTANLDKMKWIHCQNVSLLCLCWLIFLFKPGIEICCLDHPRLT